jgi:hypothetical protein
LSNQAEGITLKDLLQANRHPGQNLDKRQVTEVIRGNEAKLLFAYRGTISVGNPVQNFSVLFDTGSYQFWVKSSECTSSPACLNQKLFRMQESTTFSNLNTSAPEIKYVGMIFFELGITIS